ncbi:hypothetical protein QR680_002236 [Steinernema hermaphroditum]|uniref:Uncharacterized protein n=1 Tax=Steinernema hermaphroditum TaxID=289476 RepID=A0AA39H1X8_9BILA|nr:hypothetical protein QR680_002236 [Steinernema hermaphroditum]
MTSTDLARGDSDPPSAPEPPHVHRQKKIRIVKQRGRSVQVDDVLWFACFLMTYWFFDIPNTLWSNHKIDRQYLNSSLTLLLVFLVLSLYIFWKASSDYLRIWKQFPVLFVFSFLVLCTAVTLFCLSTWKVWNVWSLYIVFVTTMTLNATAAISL